MPSSGQKGWWAMTSEELLGRHVLDEDETLSDPMTGRGNFETVTPDSDAEVGTLVRAALVASLDLAKATVTVEVYSGRIVLRGRVRSLWERITAEQIACSVPGVTRVQDWLVVDRIEKPGEKN